MGIRNQIYLKNQINQIINIRLNSESDIQSNFSEDQRNKHYSHFNKHGRTKREEASKKKQKQKQKQKSRELKMRRRKRLKIEKNIENSDPQDHD